MAMKKEDIQKAQFEDVLRLATWLGLIFDPTNELSVRSAVRWHIWPFADRGMY